MIRSRHLFLILAVLCAAHDAHADDFYAGKTLTLSTHTGVGGGYDSLIRLIARFMNKHIAGQPQIIVVNMPGAGGLTAFNYLARIAPRDGTYLSLIGQGLMIYEPTGQSGLQESLGALSWIGNVSQSANVTAVWYTSPTHTLADARAHEVVLGSTGVSSPDAQIPTVYNAILGTHFKLVYGYEGGGTLNLAMERGEIEGRGTNTWPSYKATWPEAVRLHQLIPLIQIGLKKDPDLMDVPLFLDVVRGDSLREPVAQFLSLATALSRPLAGPPLMPTQRLALLRHAFDDLMLDDAFLAEAQRQHIDIDPMGGDEVQKSVAQILATPSAVIDHTKAALAGHPL